VLTARDKKDENICMVKNQSTHKHAKETVSKQIHHHGKVEKEGSAREYIKYNVALPPPFHTHKKEHVLFFLSLSKFVFCKLTIK